MTTAAEKSIIVIGAGMAGLAAAHRLAHAGFHVSVLEKNAYPGGRVYSPTFEGRPVDVGAQFLAGFYRHTFRLIRELGLHYELAPVPGTSAVLRAGRLYKLWPDARVAFSGLVPVRSKLRLLKAVREVLAHWGELDFNDFAKAAALDRQSLADYAQQALDEQVLEFALQPLLASLLDWTPEHTSQAMLFLLLKAGLNIRLSTLRAGLQQLPRALAARLNVRYDADVLSVVNAPTGGYALHARIAGQPQSFNAAGLVCAVPAPAVPGLFPGLDDRQRNFFDGIHYSANLIATVGVDHRLPGDLYSVIFPRREAKTLAAASIQSAKGPGLAAPDRDALVLSPSGPAGEALYGRDDTAVIAALLADLCRAGAAYDVRGGVTSTYVQRWAQALPVFDVGHLQKLKSFAEQPIERAGLVFAGDYLGGPFIEGAITSGYAAAQRLAAALR
jgi:oxygen-dependent protoporphyrinogen oxidase